MAAVFFITLHFAIKVYTVFLSKYKLLAALNNKNVEWSIIEDKCYIDALLWHNSKTGSRQCNFFALFDPDPQFTC